MRRLHFFQLILLLVFSSCATRSGYKNRTFIKHSVPGKTMKEVIYEAKMRNFDGGTVFVHHEDSIIQLIDVTYFNDTISREFNGVITMTDPDIIKVYDYMKKYPKGYYEVSRETFNDFKQMHFYVTGFRFHEKDNAISVSEDEIDRYDKYYPKAPRNVKIVMGAILGGAVGVPVIVLLIQYLAWAL